MPGPAQPRSQIRIISIPDYVGANPRGIMVLPRVSELVELVFDTSCSAAEPMPVLIDLRGVSELLPVDDAFALMNQLRELGYCGQRIALVYQEHEKEHRAALINLWARNRNVRVHAFSDYEEALSWLEHGDWWEPKSDSPRP